MAADVQFREVAREAGPMFTRVNGASPDKHFVEIMGSGCTETWAPVSPQRSRSLVEHSGTRSPVRHMVVAPRRSGGTQRAMVAFTLARAGTAAGAGTFG